MEPAINCTLTPTGIAMTPPLIFLVARMCISEELIGTHAGNFTLLSQLSSEYFFRSIIPITYTFFKDEFCEDPTLQLF